MSQSSLKSLVLRFAVVTNIDEVFLGLASVALWLSDYFILPDLCLWSEVRTTDCFVNVDIDIRFVNDLSIR